MPNDRLNPTSTDDRSWPRLLAPWLVLALAVLVRGWKLTDWSLWEDEETTIYFSQQLAKPFPRFFPVFFVLLNRWFDWAGLSVAAGRLLAGGIGVLGVAVTYHVCRRLVSRPAALWAALLLAVNLGHLFWSQSIRYFGLLFVFELLSLYSFYRGFEDRKAWLLFAANVCFALALWTHFSAILLAPVFAGYLLLAAWRPQGEQGYATADYAAFFAPLAVVLAVFAKSLLDAKAFLSSMPLESARNPLHVFMTLAAYFGLPTIGLALLSPLVAVGVHRRTLIFFGCCALLPVAELAVIAGLNLVNVTWYYGIIALFGFVALSGVAISSLAERGRRGLAAIGALAALVYATAHLVPYYTTMHGDRPRWRDAGEYLRHTAGVDIRAENRPEVFANVPGVVAFYLGVAPKATMTDGSVQRIPDEPPEKAPRSDQWYVVEAGHVTPAYAAWLEKSCRLEADFAARTGPRDRTISVYHYAAGAEQPRANDISSNRN